MRATAPLLTEAIVDGRTTAQRGPVTDETYAEALASLGDAVVARLLAAKHEDDAVPMAVWWLVADSLRATALASRAVGWTSGPVSPADGGELVLLLERAMTACKLAGAKLVERCGVEPSPIAGSADRDGASAVAEVRRTDLRLARLLTRDAPTSPTLLLVRIEALFAALSDWQRSSSRHP
jgi:hypothetical protein